MVNIVLLEDRIKVKKSKNRPSSVASILPILAKIETQQRQILANQKKESLDSNKYKIIYEEKCAVIFFHKNIYKGFRKGTCNR
jgi:hypothetical protein